MSKPIVEQSPIFDPKILSSPKFSDYYNKYQSVDEKGRYLPWSELKWRLPKNEEKEIWAVIQLKRNGTAKMLTLKDKYGNFFHYNTFDQLEANLHKVLPLAGGVPSIGGTKASHNMQSKFLISSLIMEEAITSSQLEGAATTREIAKKMLEEEREPRDADERMILNNYYLMKHAKDVIDEPLSIDLIKRFHEIATKECNENNVIPGEFRNSDDIYIGDRYDEPLYIPPSYKGLEERMEEICKFANFDHTENVVGKFIPPIIKAIILHFMIGYEHAFRDGNGRTARAIFYWFILKSGYSIFEYISISKLLKTKVKDYGLSYLYVEKDHADLTYFIDFQLKIILEAFNELKQYLKRKDHEFQEIVELLETTEKGSKLKFVQKDLIKKGNKEPGRTFTAKEVANSYDISENTARGYLNKLCEMKLFLSTQDGNTKIYLAPSDLKQRLGHS